MKEVFDTAAGKFGIGHVNNYIYLDLQIAYQQMVVNTLKQMGKDTSKSALVRFMNSPFFDLQHYASEATINLPDRIGTYSNPDY